MDKPDTPEELEQIKQMNARLESLVTREISWFHEGHNEIVFMARTIPILVLGDHPLTETEENVFTKVIKKLRERYHSAIPLKDVSRIGNHIHSERLAIRRYPVVIKVDTSDLKSLKPGSVGENVLISHDKKCQEKTFLFLKDTPENTKMVYSIEHYCLYFPRTYFCKDDNDMVEKAVMMAERESYRLAYLIHQNPSLQSEIFNNVGSNI